MRRNVVIIWVRSVDPIIASASSNAVTGVSALPFIGIIIGVLCGATVITIHSKTRYRRRLRDEDSVPAEERLVPMIIGGAVLPIGLFWFAWTSFPTISPWPQIISGIPLGMGLQIIFLQGFNYIIDCYLMYSNSAIAANTFFRSWIGAGFPLIALPMSVLSYLCISRWRTDLETRYKNLGVRWATSTLGFIALA
jgi:MFS transporter, DHA1 family, multidrug resistance protein